MKKLYAWLALIAFFAAAPNAFAAVTLADSGSINATSIVANTSASVGDLIIVAISDYPVGTPAISDNKNGSYALLTGATAPTTSVQLSVGYIRVTVAGTPTISGDANTGHIVYQRYTGFSGTATMLLTDQASADQDPGTALNSGSFSTSKSNEYVVAFTGAGTDFTGGETAVAGVSGGWTSESSVSYVLYSYTATSNPLASATSVAITGTVSSSFWWVAGVYGFYDNISSPAPLISNGHPLISNGHPVISQ